MTIEIIVKITESRPCAVCMEKVNERKSAIHVLGDYKAMKNLEKQLPLDDFRFHQVQAYLNWFEPAWEALSPQQRLILETFYMGGESDLNTEILLTLGLGISLTTLYRQKRKALTALVEGLYGTKHTE